MGPGDRNFVNQLASHLRQAARADDLKPGDMDAGGWFEKLCVDALTTAFEVGAAGQSKNRQN